MTRFSIFLRLKGMKVIFTVLIMMLLNLIPVVLSAQGEFRFGIIGKVESNRLKIENTDNLTEVKNQPGVQGAGGLYAAFKLNRYWFLDASVLLSRAKYTVNYSRLSATFMDADVRFTQTNLNLNLVLNPNSERIQLFLFGGTQLLYRRWGEERFVQHVLDHSYWPAARLMLQGGLGTKIEVGEHCVRGPHLYLQPFAGFRYLPSQNLVYDVSVNQVFAGLVIMRGNNVKRKAKNCNHDF